MAPAGRAEASEGKSMKARAKLGATAAQASEEKTWASMRLHQMHQSEPVKSRRRGRFWARARAAAAA